MKYVYIESWHHYCRTELELEGRTAKFLHWQLVDAYESNAPADAVHKKLVFDNNPYSSSPPRWMGEWVTVRDLILNNIWELSNPVLQEFLAYSSDRMLYKQAVNRAQEENAQAHREWTPIEGGENNNNNNNLRLLA